MDIATANLAQEVKTTVKNVGTTIVKPLSVTACAGILSNLFYDSVDNSFFGLEINEKYFHTGAVGLVSWFESSLRNLLLPRVIGEKLSHAFIDLTSPFVVGLATLLLKQGVQFYNFKTYLSLKRSLYSFAFGFTSEVAGVWLYNNLVKPLTEQMFV